MSSKKAKQKRREEGGEKCCSSGKCCSSQQLIWGVATVVLVLLVVLLAWPSGDAGDGGGDYDDFAKCLTDEGMTMYGTDWCSACSKQKEMFGDSFDYIDYVNCDFNDCSLVKGYPTWMKDGEPAGDMGTKTFDVLSELTGCEY